MNINERRRLNSIFIAVLSLTTELSNKRYGIIKSSDQEKEVDQECRNLIINEIKAKYNIDFFEVMASNDVEYMLRYEALLSDYLSNILKQYSTSNVDDELKLLDITHDITTLDIFEGKKINIEDSVKRVFGEIKEGTKHIENYIYSPDYISVIESEFETDGITATSNFLLTRKVSNRDGIQSIFFALLAHNQHPFVESFDLELALMMNYKINEAKFNSPIKMFLYLLNRYGIELELNETKKKFFFKEEISKDKFYDVASSYIQNLNRDKKNNVLIRGVGKDNEDEKTLDFAFGFDYGKYVKDYNSKLI